MLITGRSPIGVCDAISMHHMADVGIISPKHEISSNVLQQILRDTVQRSESAPYFRWVND